MYASAPALEPRMKRDTPVNINHFALRTVESQTGKLFTKLFRRLTDLGGGRENSAGDLRSTFLQACSDMIALENETSDEENVGDIASLGPALERRVVRGSNVHLPE